LTAGQRGDAVLAGEVGAFAGLWRAVGDGVQGPFPRPTAPPPSASWIELLDHASIVVTVMTDRDDVLLPPASP
jgi:hypothetical protein